MWLSKDCTGAARGVHHGARYWDKGGGPARPVAVACLQARPAQAVWGTSLLHVEYHLHHDVELYQLADVILPAPRSL